MIRHDLTHWPLITSMMQGTVTLDEQMAFLADWTSWLDRGERFATLRVFAGTDALARAEGGAKETKMWLQTNKDRIKALVVGMATVVPAERLEEVSRMNAEKLFGVPARTFADVEEAANWITSQLAEKQVTIHPGVITASLSAMRH
ncbi:hypothetical protein [Sphingomonas sp. 37zxx]|uniref:hypothetical protein n=1 Tax=Sphingomonas sp. 37zxx TaxID=1550073 RepID=UPI00053BEE5A|nr:hypothetical protein [Sphingomonas sp. 37zxx]